MADQKLLDDLVRRVTRLERNKVSMRIGVITDNDPPEVEIGDSGISVSVIPLRGADGQINDICPVLFSGNDALALGDTTPRFFGRVYWSGASSAQALTTNVQTQITLASEDEDTHGFWTSGTSLTIPSGYDGIYAASARIIHAANTGGTARDATIFKNGTLELSTRVVDNTAMPNFDINLTVSGLLELAAGNTVSFGGLQNSGGNNNATVATARICRLSR